MRTIKHENKLNQELGTSLWSSREEISENHNGEYFVNPAVKCAVVSI